MLVRATVRRAAIIGYGVTVVAELAKLRIDNAVATHGDRTVGVTGIGVLRVAIIAGFAWVTNSIATGFIRRAVGVAAVASALVAVVARFIEGLVTITTHHREAPASSTPPIR